MSIFCFSENKKNVDELLYFIRKKSSLKVKVEDKSDENIVMSMVQRADEHELKINSKDISDVLTRVDSQNKDFMQVNFKNKSPILITEQFIGFNPLGNKIEGLPEVVTTIDLKEVYKVTFELLHFSKSEDQILPEEIQRLKEMFFAIVAGGVEAGFHLQKEKQDFQYLIMSLREAVSA